MEYKIKEHGFNEIRKKVMLRSLPFLLLAGFAGLAIAYFNSASQSSEFTIFPILIPILVGAMVVGVLRGLKRQKEIFNSFTLLVDDEKIMRKQYYTDDIVIPFSEIKEIHKTRDGTLSIKGKKATEIIGVPAQLEGIDALEIRLKEISEITTGDKKTLILKVKWVIPVLVLGLMMLVYLSENKLVVGVSGVILTLALLYSVFLMRKNKQVDNKTKRSMWLALIVLASIIGVTCVKVFGGN